MQSQNPFSGGPQEFCGRHLSTRNADLWKPNPGHDADWQLPLRTQHWQPELVGTKPIVSTRTRALIVFSFGKCATRNWQALYGRVSLLFFRRSCQRKTETTYWFSVSCEVIPRTLCGTMVPFVFLVLNVSGTICFPCS